jgi:hypothetical protein
MGEAAIYRDILTRREIIKQKTMKLRKQHNLGVMA